MLVLTQLRQLEKLQAQGDHRQLLSQCDQILASHPGLGPVWYLRGDSLLQLGDPELAAHSFQEASRCGAEIRIPARLAQAACLRQVCRPEEALAALADCPEDPPSQVLRIQLYLQAAQPAQARQLLERYDGPRAEMLDWLRVESLARGGRGQEAKELLDRCEDTAVVHHLRSLLSEAFVAGHPGMVDSAMKLANGVAPELVELLNHPLSVHVQQHLGLLQDVRRRPDLLVVRPTLRFPGLRLVTHGLLLSMPWEENWAAPLLAGLAHHPHRQGQIVPNGPKLCPQCPYAGFLLYPSISVPSGFHHGADMSFLAVYPLYHEELTTPLPILLQRWESQGIGDLVVSGRINCGL